MLPYSLKSRCSRRESQTLPLILLDVWKEIDFDGEETSRINIIPKAKKLSYGYSHDQYARIHLAFSIIYLKE